MQQHIWTTTLGDKAVVFTNHPGSIEYIDRPNYWVGNGVMPKAVAYKNVLICIYRIEPTYTRLWQTHLFFPQHEFDEVIMKDKWIFGRKNGGYIAVHCMNGGKRLEPQLDLYKFVYKFDTEFDYFGVYILTGTKDQIFCPSLARLTKSTGKDHVLYGYWKFAAKVVEEIQISHFSTMIHCFLPVRFPHQAVELQELIGPILVIEEKGKTSYTEKFRQKV